MFMSKEESYVDFNVDEFVKCQSVQRLFVFCIVKSDERNVMENRRGGL